MRKQNMVVPHSTEVKLVTETKRHSTDQKPKPLTFGSAEIQHVWVGLKKKCSSSEKLLILAACVASPLVAGSLSAGEAGQCQVAMFYELVSTKVATFPQASHLRT